MESSKSEVYEYTPILYIEKLDNVFIKNKDVFLFDFQNF